MRAPTITSRSRSVWRNCSRERERRCVASSRKNPPCRCRRFGDLEVDLARRLVTRTGEQVHLTPTEYGLLEALVTNPGKLLTHQWLLRKVWGQGYGTETTYLRTYVRALRKKLGDDAQAPGLIVTEPGIGYRWVAEAD